MSVETIGLHQTALYWETAENNYGGYTIKSNTPREISCRWQWNERGMASNEDTTPSVDATVITNENIPLYSQMWLGDLDTIPGTGTSPIPTVDLMTVVSKRVVPDIKGRKLFVELSLQRRKGYVTQ